MKNLILNNKIEVRKSKIHGYGVFAKEKIKKDEILEECHIISFPKEYYDLVPLYRNAYVFPRNDNYKEIVLPLGYGCIYNSSHNPNADWITDEKRRLIIFKSIEEIEKNEEICWDYEVNIVYCIKNNLI